MRGSAVAAASAFGTCSAALVADLMNWGKTVPSMLLFIPSKDGVSHSIREYSAPEDLYRGP